MRKSKFLALVLVVALAVMGSAYAYWNDALNITTTASTGELNVQFAPSTGTSTSVAAIGAEAGYYKMTGTAGYDDYENTADSKLESTYTNKKGVGQYSTGDYVFDKDNVLGEKADFRITPVDNAKSLIMEISNLYPGSGAYIKDLLIVNKGTIGAKIENAKISGIEIYKGTTKLTEGTTFNNIMQNLEFGIKYNNKYNACSLWNMNYHNYDPFVNLYDVVLDTKIAADRTQNNKAGYDTATLQYVYVQINPALKDNDTQNLKVKFTLTTNWTQHNNLPAPEEGYLVPSNITSAQ